MDINALLLRFIREECAPYVRAVLLQGVSDLSAPSSVRKYEFNRFELTLDRDSQSVLLEDILDSTEEGQLRFSFAELVAALQALNFIRLGYQAV
jgi:hypothetical protein